MRADLLSIVTPEGAFSAHLAKPAADPAPAIVVIPGPFGLNAGARELCQAFATEGYLALCPDLYWRARPTAELSEQTEADWPVASACYRALDLDVAMADIAAAAAAVRALDCCTGKVGAFGFLGLLAFLAATRTNVDASAGYYGVGLEAYLGDAGGLTTPYLLHIAEGDAFVPAQTQAAILAALGNPPAEVHVYEGREHGFARAAGPRYHAADAALAERRTLDFFGRTLG